MIAKEFTHFVSRAKVWFRFGHSRSRFETVRPRTCRDIQARSVVIDGERSILTEFRQKCVGGDDGMLSFKTTALKFDYQSTNAEDDVINEPMTPVNVWDGDGAQ